MEAIGRQAQSTDTTENFMPKDDFDCFNARELLKVVNKAIYLVSVGGQSYKIGSRSYTRANLTELKRLRDNLMAEVRSESKSSLMSDTYVATFEGPR